MDQQGGHSSDEALCEILGLKGLDAIQDIDEVGEEGQSERYPSSPWDQLPDLSPLSSQYKNDSVCKLPQEYRVNAAWIRHLTDQLVWGGDQVSADRTYETIRVRKRDGTIEERRTLTRLENFVSNHPGWKDLCKGYVARLISELVGEPMILYKEKLNLKPPGGSGFAPHLDSPSLRVALGNDGPQTFCTVMIAIDKMTVENGCLRVTRGTWTEQHHVEIVEPEDDNPDAGGRRGAIPSDIAESLAFDDLECHPGDIVVFNGWAPHRSKANSSSFPRRAVFLTYNPLKEGDCHDLYYRRMKSLRDDWRVRLGLDDGTSRHRNAELEGLKTIPRI